MTVDEGSRVHGASHSRLAHDEGSPLSPFQERLWIHYLRDPENTSYNLPLMLLVEGRLDVSALEQSLSEIVGRHESLRTYYRSDGRRRTRAVHRAAGARPLAGRRCRPRSNAGAPRATSRAPIRSSPGPIFIANLLRLSDERHLPLVERAPHCGGCLVAENHLSGRASRALMKRSAAQSVRCCRLTVQYKDYASSQRALDVSAHLDYWRRKLEGYEDSLELPAGSTRQAKACTKSATFVHRYPSEFSQSLERLSRRHGCDLHVVARGARRHARSPYEQGRSLHRHHDFQPRRTSSSSR